jgi:hypothetical protein
METYGKFMYPLGKEPGREADPFYTADFLASQGFRVVTGPASSCFGDSVFAPSHWLRVANTFDSVHKGRSKGLHGSIVTSWTVRLVPWTLQLAAIDAPGFVYAHPERSLNAYQKSFMRNRFGRNDDRFWRACGLLTRMCLFLESKTLGFYKNCRPAPGNQVDTVLQALVAEGRLDAELANARLCLDGYREAKDLFSAFARRAARGHEYLKLWDLAARNLINRAEVCIFILEHEKARVERRQDNAPHRETGRAILEELRTLRAETEAMYETSIKPMRRAQMVGWIYDPVDRKMREILDGTD